MPKNIEFNVTINDGQASSKFATLDKSVTNLGVKAKSTGQAFNNFSRRDLGLFATQALYNVDVTGKLGSQLGNLGTALATGGFIGAGFAAGAALLNLITEEAKVQTKAITELREEYNKYVDGIAKRGAELKELDLGRLAELQNLERVQKAIIANAKVLLGGNINPLVKRTPEEQKIFLEFVKATEAAGALRKEIDYIIFGWDKFYDTLDKPKPFEKTKEGLKEIRDLLNEMWSKITGLDPEGRLLAKGFSKSQLKQRWFGKGMFEREQERSPLGGIIPSEKELRESFALFDAVAMGSMDTLRDVGIQAWSDIFGEANSLFEKLFQNITNHFLALAGGKIGDAILGGLIGLFLSGGNPAGAAIGAGLGKTNQRALGEFFVQGQSVARKRRVGY